jgi:hypothetical protein
MLANPGFEDGAKTPLFWKSNNIESSLFSRDTTVAHSGKASLRWENSAPNNYQLLSQSVKLEPGRMYELSAWIKTENLIGARESGATICMGLSDEKGKYIKGGPHPGGQKGTGDWWHLLAYTGPISEETPQGSFTCYVRKNDPKSQTFTGTAWWDDICIRPVSFYARMLTPSYKRMVFDQNSILEFEIDTYPEDYDLAFSDVLAAIDVLDANGKQIKQVAFNITMRRQNIVLDLKSLAPGEYTVVAKLLRRVDGNQLWDWKFAIRKMDDNATTPTVWIDDQGRTLVNGKEFFPLGVYTRKYPVDLSKGIAIIADSPFNCFISYDSLTMEQMDQAHEAELKVIYSVKDYFNKIWFSPKSIESVDDEVPALKKTIREFRNHPALLAWYTNDELGPDALVQHWSHYETINKEDPNHPSWNLHDKPEDMNILMNACDIIGIDSYPIPPEKPLSEVARDTTDTIEGVRNAKPTWAVLTIYNPSSMGGNKKDTRPPTLTEMRCSSWLAICSGARGLIYYALHNVQRDKDPRYTFERRWPEIKQMADELAQRTDILLGDSNCPEITVDAPAWLHWTARQVDDTVYIIAVSDGDGEGRANFSINADIKEVEYEIVGGSVEDPVISSKSKWSDTFYKNDVRIYSMQLSK